MAIDVYNLNKDNYLQYKDCIINVRNNVDLKGLGLKKLPFRINECWGTKFDVSFNELEDLSDCPFKVDKDNTIYDCSSNKLTNLMYSPRKVLGFICKGNGLTNLEGCPKEIGYDFVASNNKINDLRWLPKKVGNMIDLSFNRLQNDDLNILLGKKCNYEYVKLSYNGVDDTSLDIFYNRLRMLKTFNRFNSKKICKDVDTI